MKRHSHTIALGAIATATALALTGCAGSPGATSSSGSTQSVTGKSIAFIPGVSSDGFYITMGCGIKAEAKKYGLKVTDQGPTQFSPTLQRPILDSIVASKPDALLIAPTDVSAFQAPLQNAAQSGIKVVLVDTTTKDPSFATSAISSDNEKGGELAFQELQKLQPTGGKVLVISTDPGVSTLDQRTAGFEKAVKGDSKFTYLGVQYSHDVPATAASLMTAALQKNPDIVGVFAPNTESAEGTATGLRQANAQNRVKVIGFDADPPQVAQLKSGVVQALIAQRPYLIGTQAVDQAVKSLTGKPVKKTIATTLGVLTNDNLNGSGAQYLYKSTCS